MDSGNFSDNPTPEGDLKTNALLRAMDQLGYAAANVGDRELVIGYDAFVKRTAGARLPFISSNIVRQDTAEPVFKPYTVVKAKSPDGSASLKVGLVGATRFNPLFLKAGPEGSNLVIAKPEEALPQYVEEVRKQADVVVLLAALHKEEARRIVQSVPGIDLVVGAYGGMISVREEKAGDAWLLYAGNQGKRVGETRVYLQADRRIQSAETYLHMLSAVYPSNQPMLDYVNGIHAELKALKGGGQATATTGTQAAR